MEVGVLAMLGAVGLGGFVAYKVARDERVRHVIGAGARGGEKVLAFSASTTLRVGAVVAAGASTAAAHSGSGLLRAAKLIDRAAA